MQMELIRVRWLEGAAANAIVRELGLKGSRTSSIKIALRELGLVWEARRVTPTGQSHHSWTGGVTTTVHGYVVVTVPRDWLWFDQMVHDKTKRRVFEHRKVMAEVLGRPLYADETVHHKNGVRSDNHPENLELWVSHQPEGQRPADLLRWADEIIERYATLKIAS